jgi:CubicO group peptidase (beta-lactamase class C family)
MKTFQRILAVLLVWLAGTAVFAQSSRPPLPDTGSSEIDTLLRRAVQQGTIPGVVAIVAGKDRILYEGAFGLMDVARQKPMQKDSIFRIASMTKPVTSVAIMMLVDEGKVRLDDPVSKFIPSLKNPDVLADFNIADATYTTRKAKNEISIRHLLSNTSGFAYTFANEVANTLQQKKGKGAEEPPLLYEPGTQWTYSGSTKILGQVVEKISGMRLDEFFNQRLFQPLNLQDTFYAVPAAKAPRVVTTHRRAAGALTESPNPDRFESPVAGDGGLFSTASDYVRFLQMLLNEGRWDGRTFLRRESVRAMASNQIGRVLVQTQHTTNPALSQSFPNGAGSDKFGLGFQITSSNKENRNLRAPGSYTWAGIYNTHFWVDPERQIVAVIMIQVLPFYDDGAMKVYQDFEEAIGRNLK